MLALQPKNYLVTVEFPLLKAQVESFKLFLTLWNEECNRLSYKVLAGRPLFVWRPVHFPKFPDINVIETVQLLILTFNLNHHQFLLDFRLLYTLSWVESKILLSFKSILQNVIFTRIEEPLVCCIISNYLVIIFNLTQLPVCTCWPICSSHIDMCSWN